MLWSTYPMQMLTHMLILNEYLYISLHRIKLLLQMSSNLDVWLYLIILENDFWILSFKQMQPKTFSKESSFIINCTASKKKTTLKIQNKEVNDLSLSSSRIRVECLMVKLKICHSYRVRGEKGDWKSSFKPTVLLECSRNCVLIYTYTMDILMQSFFFKLLFLYIYIYCTYLCKHACTHTFHSSLKGLNAKDVNNKVVNSSFTFIIYRQKIMFIQC